jgi:hypothetical protein
MRRITPMKLNMFSVLPVKIRRPNAPIRERGMERRTIAG